MSLTLSAAPAAPVRRLKLLELRAEVGCRTIWCGPAVVARLLDCSYAKAEALFRQHNPRKHGGKRRIVFTYWEDLLRIIEAGGKTRGPGYLGGVTAPVRTLIQWSEQVEPGWYALRAGQHFLIAHVVYPGHVLRFDNQAEGRVVTGKRGAYGRSRVTHWVKVAPPPV